MFDSVLVANRGEIALRVLRTLRELGVASVAVYSDADAGARHVREADRAYRIGPGPAAQSYLDAEAVLAALRASGAAAVHPGYGFLSENPEFARAVVAAGAAWVGPAPEVIAAMGDKVAARAQMAAAGVAVVPGSDGPVTAADAPAVARRVGYPVMVKAAAGGGGIGMGVARDPEELLAAVATARSRSERFFADPTVYLERYLERARHVEVQVLGRPGGHVVALGERDCSVQRRHQKVAEEGPSPALTPPQRAGLLAAGVRAAASVGYTGAGTVEFLLDLATGEFFFLEMNTRLQVEHPVTEMLTGVDLVAEQLRVAAGDPSGFDPQAPPPVRGHALELRVYAEDPVRFLPGPGRITHWREPAGEGVRVDAGYAAGDDVTPFYDPLLAKLVVWGADRAAALERARAALAGFEVAGPKVNLAFLSRLLAEPAFVRGDYDTSVVDRMQR